MFKKAILIAFIMIGWAGQGVGAQQTLQLSDTQKVMEKLFALHIENKDFNPTIVRRSFKLYIEQFDGDKSYLLASEVNPYLNMSDKMALEVVARLKKEDYSDYLALQSLFQRAIHRAEGVRAMLAQNLLQTNIDLSGFSTMRYAASESELIDRQQVKMVRFFVYHQSKTSLESQERKAKVFSLYEKKIRRAEASALFRTASGDPMTEDAIEHYLSTKILKSMAKSLDTHTSFFSPEEAQEMRLSLEKQFEGVGVVLSEGIDGVMIADIVKGSPAEQSGQIEVNDLLVEIDGRSLNQVTFEDVLELLKKKDRGEIILGFQRMGSFFRVSLNKQPIHMTDERIQTGVEKVENGVIGKIALHSFYESNGISSEKDIREAIRSFRREGELQGLVLDLRNNSGGFLNQAVKVAGLFLSNGVVAISKYGKGEVHYLRNLSGRQYYSGPVVILISKMSASAAEIVAQALQDYGVAVVVGDERSFGKGSIQYQTVTDDSAELYFKVTVGRYYTASGRSTQIDGVIADIQVPTQYAPYNIGERFLEYPLSPDAVDAAYDDTLSDLDERAQFVFRQRYLPFLQRKVSFWKNAMPELKSSSAARLAKSSEFQLFLRKIEQVRARQIGQPVNTVDEHIQMGMKDLQMMEAIHIVEDMIRIQTEASVHDAALAPTGSD